MFFLALQINGQQDMMHLNPIVSALPFGLQSTSNGSLSDSGISDGGGSSDYGLSERERRLSALRRLARQLENALAPGSAALNSISQRMEAAESDLRSLQDTCRQLIVRTAATKQQQHQQQPQQENQANENRHETIQQLHLIKPKLPPTFIELIPEQQSIVDYSVPAISAKGKTKRSPQR